MNGLVIFSLATKSGLGLGLGLGLELGLVLGHDSFLVAVKETVKSVQLAQDG